MSHYYTSQTYVEASVRLDSACTWLQSIGVNYSPTRLGRYRKLFETFAKHQQSNTLNAFADGANFEDWANAVHEVAKITRIFEGLNTQDNKNLVERLKKALKGHEMYALDDNDHSGRDFGLELSVAAKFVQSGYSVDFGHDADVAVDIENFKFYVECKRLKSELQIEKRITEGLKQLVTRYKGSPTPSLSRGILVLSIGKIVNSNLGLLVAENSRALADAAFRYNVAFIEQYKSCWQLNVDQRTLGVAIILDAPGEIKAEKKLVTCHEITVNNSVPINTENYEFLFRITHQVFDRQLSNAEQNSISPHV